MIKKFISLPNITLLTALTLSTIAAWYSIIGLTAIFASAVIPIIVMGGSLEFAKVITTVWLHRYWKQINWKLKLYLVPAVISLAFLTSMGIFGFLSKAHIDQGVPTGDIAAKVAILDEKIKTQRENIEIARKALAQMDEQVNQRLSRGTSEQGAERAVVIRRQQAGERAKLQKEIADAQNVISKLNEERAPIASELRKVEAEVGPIKYIAALIYDDNPDQATLERAVRWVIILIVFVFDPLALTLVIAANGSRRWEEELQKELEEKNNQVDEPLNNVEDIVAEEPVEQEVLQEKVVENEQLEMFEEPKEKEFDLKDHPYLFKPWVWFPVANKVFNPGFKHAEPVEVKEEPIVTTVTDNITIDKEITIDQEPVQDEIVTAGVTIEQQKPFQELEGGYVTYQGKHMHRDALKSLHPELFMVKIDNAQPAITEFGIKFPEVAKKGEIFVRVDVLPNRVFKFDGRNWIEVQKEQSDTYLHNQKYIQYLVERIEKGEYDVELLSDQERDEIAQYLSTQKLDK